MKEFKIKGRARRKQFQMLRREYHRLEKHLKVIAKALKDKKMPFNVRRKFNKERNENDKRRLGIKHIFAQNNVRFKPIITFEGDKR